MVSVETEKPKSKRRRWSQFSLRTFLVLLTLACLWIGWHTQQARQQRAAVEALRNRAARVFYDYQVDSDGNSISDAAPPSRKWLPDLIRIDFFDNVVRVELARVEDSDLSLLLKFKHLESLSLHEVSGGDLALLATLAKLKRVQFRSASDGDMTQLAKLTSLEHLLLSGHVSDVTPLAELTQLRHLSLGIPVTDLRPLSKLTLLESLILQSDQLADLTPVAKLTKLRSLWLVTPQVDDLSPLGSLTSLEILILLNPTVSDEQKEFIRQKLPNCKIQGW